MREDLTNPITESEDRVIACITGDTNKLAIFLNDLDGHSLATYYYAPDKVEAIVGKHDDYIDTVKAFMQAVDDGDKAAKALRQWSKNKTFKLA